MAKITQYSRISHHTIAGSASAGLTFSVPAQEDFTDGSWTPYDLALSEIGVNEQDKKVYIRIDDEILEFGLYGSGSSIGVTPSWGQVLSVGNTSDGNDIIMNSGGQILSGTGEILNAFSDTGIDINANDTIYNQELTMTTAAGSVNLGTTDISTTAYNSLLLDTLNSYLFLTSFNPVNATAQINLDSSAAPAIIVDLSISGTTSRLQFDTSIAKLQRSDASTFDNRIDISNTDMLLEAEDLVNNKQANLDLTHAYTYLSHFNNGLLSYIEAIDNTILLQTQGAPGQIDINSTNGTIKLRGFDENIIYDRGLSGTDGNFYNQDRVSTTNATPATLHTIGFGITNSVITIEAVVNGWGATNSKAYGAKLFGTFKNAGGTVTQLSTTDKSEKTDFSTATSDFNISGTDINVRVTGEASTDINWVSRFNYQISK